DLLEKDATLAQRIPKEECQKMAILDLVSLNLDRHSGNFLVADAKSASPMLIPIDHGQVLPSRDGLLQRSGRLGAPHMALSMLPAVEEPFTPEMKAVVAAIDPDQVVAGMREADKVMARQFPAESMKAEINDENYALVKRSCEFLKAAVAAGLSPAELFDAYARQPTAIFDTPGAQRDATFQQVIQDVQARSAARQQAKQDTPTNPDELAAMSQKLRQLGWDVKALKPNDTKLLLEFQQFLLATPKLVEAAKHDLVNAQLAADITQMEADCKAKGIPLPDQSNA